MNKKLIVSSIVLTLSGIFFQCSAAEQKQATTVKSVEMENSNPIRGQQVYAKRFYKVCGITCDEMAKKYTQVEWESAYGKGKVQDLIGKYCPIMDDLNDREQRLIYDFMYNHAKDSGFVAPCKD